MSRDQQTVKPISDAGNIWKGNRDRKKDANGFWERPREGDGTAGGKFEGGRERTKSTGNSGRGEKVRKPMRGKPKSCSGLRRTERKTKQKTKKKGERVGTIRNNDVSDETARGKRSRGARDWGGEGRPGREREGELLRIKTTQIWSKTGRLGIRVVEGQRNKKKRNHQRSNHRQR